MQIQFIPALKIIIKKKPEKNLLQLFRKGSENFPKHGCGVCQELSYLWKMSPSSLLLFWGPALAQSGFSAFLQQLCSSPIPSAVWSLQTWETESSPLNLPGSVRKPKSTKFRVSLLLMQNFQYPRASIASHGCKCLVNNLQENSGMPKGGGLWEAGSPKLSVSNPPFVSYSWKEPQNPWTWQAMGLHGIKGWSVLQNVHTATSQFFLLFPCWLLKIPLLMQSRAGVLWPPYEHSNL